MAHLTVVPRWSAVPRGAGMVLPALLALACSRGEAGKATDPAPPSPSASAAPALVSEYHEPTFDLVLRQDGPLTAGKAGGVTVVVTPRGEYHCNDQYPYRFRPSESPGVAFARPVFEKEDVKQSPSQTTVAVAFTPEAAGSSVVRGVISFSLCSKERCLMEKRDLGVAVAVAAP